VQDFDARISHLKEIFTIKGDLKDQGSSVVIRDKTNVLEIYRPSDSFWWFDEHSANRETTPDGSILPDDEEALKIGQEYLEKVGFTTNYSKVASVTRSSVAQLPESGKLAQEIHTEVHVGFSFTIDDDPIFGPGAKIRVSMVEGGRISSVLYFWREPQRGDGEEQSLRAINPEEALTWLTREPRFDHLTADQIRMTVETVRFGHYAVPPFRFQRFLIPVYEISGLTESRVLGRRNFTFYTPAVDLSAARTKTMSFVDQMDITRALASSK
jgi:hypothetical protein